MMEILAVYMRHCSWIVLMPKLTGCTEEKTHLASPTLPNAPYVFTSLKELKLAFID